MLVPHFIHHHYCDLDRSYISLLEIGGSHAHRLRPLIEALGIPTLVITDLDSIESEKPDKVRPATDHNYRTGNDTLKSWIPKKIALDELLAVKPEEKITNNEMVRVAYPCETSIQYTNNSVGQLVKVIPYTFEDALVLANISMFKGLTERTGLIKKMVDAVNNPTLDNACQSMFDALNKNAKKAEMALELLCTTEPSRLNPPQYIEEGLDWLNTKLKEDISLSAKSVNTSETER